jgi:hypothetical protein
MVAQIPPQPQQQSVLLAHAGATKVNREFLRSLPIPQATKTHKPVAHAVIVEFLEETLSFRQMKIVREEFAVTPDGMKCFGLLELNYELRNVRFAIGFRNSNDKSMRLAMTVGYRVIICDNMAFQGDFTPVLAKHSGKLELESLVSYGVDRIQRNFEPLKKQINDWMLYPLATGEAKEIIYDAFLCSKLEIPRHLLTKVHQHYFEPQYEEFKGRNLWSLSNAFTSAFKELLPIKQYQVTAKLGDFVEACKAPF